MRVKKNSKPKNDGLARVKRFEAANAKGIPHRLALTMASNQPGDTPEMPAGQTLVTFGMPETGHNIRAQSRREQKPSTPIEVKFGKPGPYRPFAEESKMLSDDLKK